MSIRRLQGNELINQSFKKQYLKGQAVNYHIMSNNAVLPNENEMVIHNVSKKLPKSQLP